MNLRRQDQHTGIKGTTARFSAIDTPNSSSRFRPSSACACAEAMLLMSETLFQQSRTPSCTAAAPRGAHMSSEREPRRPPPPVASDKYRCLCFASHRLSSVYGLCSASASCFVQDTAEQNRSDPCSINDG